MPAWVMACSQGGSVGWAWEEGWVVVVVVAEVAVGVGDEVDATPVVDDDVLEDSPHPLSTSGLLLKSNTWPMPRSRRAVQPARSSCVTSALRKRSPGRKEEPSGVVSGESATSRKLVRLGIV